MYQGYPFDRLRRRLGLELQCAQTVDPHDVSCAALLELHDLEPEELDDARLVEVFKSAAGFRDDTLTARFAAALASRDKVPLEKLDLTGLFAPLVRQAMERGNPAEALGWLDRARTLGTEATRQTFDTWRAEILARTGRPEEAARIYEVLVASASPTAHQVALDAALTLLDNGYASQARVFLKRACDLARDKPDSWVLSLASRHLHGLASEEVEKS
jgi:hypothetical protein